MHTLNSTILLVEKFPHRLFKDEYSDFLNKDIIYNVGYEVEKLK